MNKKFVLSLCMVVLASLVSGSLRAQQGVTSLDAARNLIELEEKQLDKPVMALLHSILYRSSDPLTTARAWKFLGDQHQQRNRFESAFMAYFTALHFDLEENERTDLIVDARLCIEKSGDLKLIGEKLSSLVNAVAGEGEGVARELMAINTLQTLEYPKLYPAIIEAAQLYAYRIPFAEEVPALWLQIREMETRQNDHWDALAAAMIVVKDYAASPLAAKAKLQIADIYANDLKKYTWAAVAYQEIIKSSADSLLHAEARWGLALLKHEKEKAIEDAVTAYQDFIDHHPEDERAAQSWMRIGALQIDRLKNYDAGISAYANLIQCAPDHALVPEARMEIGKTFENKLKDYSKAVEVYILFAQTHPEHEAAPELLFIAGRLAEDKLADPGKALEIYQSVVEQFTTKKQADQARDRIQAIEKKRSEGK